MSYYSDLSKRDKFISFWRGEMQKKLVRCSKELGFYSRLKKALSPNGGCIINDSHLKLILNDLLVSLNRGKDEILNFSDLVEDAVMDGKCKKDIYTKSVYPVYTALNDKIFLSNVYSFTILQKCNLSHRLLKDAFLWMTEEIFKGHKMYAKLKEMMGYFRIFMS